MVTNLPLNETQDSAEGTKLLFNNFGDIPAEFNATQVDATLSFFEKHGFDKEAALSVSTVLLTQAKIEKVSVMAILDTIKNVTDVELSVFISQVLNNHRIPTSILGYNVKSEQTNITRNILQ